VGKTTLAVHWPVNAPDHAPGTRPSTSRTRFRILATVSIPDARRSGPGIGWRERRTGPRHAAVWVRIGGQWRKGRIIEWVTEPGAPGWDCVILADEPAGGVPWQGRYVYEPAAIRRRDGDTPPAEPR
jgi:hypothetical protein